MVGGVNLFKKVSRLWGKEGRRRGVGEKGDKLVRKW